MDPNANLLEQLSVAKQIQAIVDCCPENGVLHLYQMEAISDHADRLSELVLALDEWIVNGGVFDYPMERS